MGSGGTGLGLHIIHNIAYQLLKGRVDVVSSVGQGTEFRVRFPVDRPSI